MDKWQIHFNTDVSMTTRDVIDSYRTRSQLALYVNASFASISLAKAACKDFRMPFPISSCNSMTHNAYMLE